MSLHTLDEVILAHDIPTRGLRAGDPGTVVHVYDSGGLEVEFLTPSGQTNAVVTLSANEVRPLRGKEVSRTGQ